MKITILGCGWSMGVPVIGCSCHVCTSDDPKNKRTRVSVLVQVNGKNILIDTSPEMRQQLVQNSISHIDAILFTHDHGDHINGFDDVRRLNILQQEVMPIYSNQPTLESIKSRFPHGFREFSKEWGWYHLYAAPHPLEPGIPFEVAGVNCVAFAQPHGKYTSLGFRMGDFAYSTDLHALSDEMRAQLQGLKLWVVDAQGHTPSRTHSTVETTLEWIRELKPERAILTHMGDELEYNQLKSTLPKGVEPAYDGIEISL